MKIYKKNVLNHYLAIVNKKHKLTLSIETKSCFYDCCNSFFTNFKFNKFIALVDKPLIFLYTNRIT